MLEWGRLYFLSGYPFATLGLQIADWPFVIPFVRVFGVYGCSYLLFFLVFMLLSFSKDQWMVYSVCLLGFFAIVSCLDPILNPLNPSHKQLKVGFVQPNLQIDQKLFGQNIDKEPLSVEEQFERLAFKMKEYVGSSLDCILFPEGVFYAHLDDYLLYGKDYERVISRIIQKPIQAKKAVLTMQETFAALARDFQACMIFGSYRKDEVEKVYNSLVAIQPNGHLQFYDKRILVPLGEYLPLRFFQKIAAKYGVHNFFEKGEEKMLTIGSFSYAPSICYEDCFPLLKASQRNLDIDFVLNITNDGWFLPSRLPKVHAKLAKIRSIELGIPIVRCCENAYSGVAYPNGEEQFFLQEVESVPVLEIKQIKYTTLYGKFGESWMLCLGIGLFIDSLLRKCKFFSLNLLKNNSFFKFLRF